MTDEECDWWVGVLRRLSAARFSTGPDGHLCRKLAAMSPERQAGLCRALLTVRRYGRQNGPEATDALLAEYPRWWADLMRSLLAEPS